MTDEFSPLLIWLFCVVLSVVLCFTVLCFAEMECEWSVSESDGCTLQVTCRYKDACETDECFDLDTLLEKALSAPREVINYNRIITGASTSCEVVMTGTGKSVQFDGMQIHRTVCSLRRFPQGWKFVVTLDTRLCQQSLEIFIFKGLTRHNS